MNVPALMGHGLVPLQGIPLKLFTLGEKVLVRKISTEKPLKLSRMADPEHSGLCLGPYLKRGQSSPFEFQWPLCFHNQMKLGKAKPTLIRPLARRL